MNTLNHAEYIINDALQSPNCNMISPSYNYGEDGNFRRQKIERKEGNLGKLETLISETMKEKHQKSILETLEEIHPIQYIDCSQKGEIDIIFFILKEYEKQSSLEDKTKILAEIIKKRTMILEPEQREEYIQSQQPTSEEMIAHYQQLLQQKLTELKPDHAKYIINCENDIAIAGLVSFMKKENKTHMYLYLDNIKHLSLEEQTRINLLLYARGCVGSDRWIYLKINNGNDSRKTRTASNGQRIQSTHDYKETYMYEEDIDPSIQKMIEE